MNIAIRVVRRALPLALAAALLGALAYHLDVHETLARLGAIAPLHLGAAVAATFVAVVISAVRYRLVLRSLSRQPVAFRPVLELNLFSVFASHLAPMGVLADTARAGLGAYVLGITPGTSALAVVIDRILALVGLLICAVIALPAAASYGTPRALLLPTAVGAALALAALAAGLLLANRPSLRRRGPWLNRSADGLVVLVGSPGPAATQLGLAVGISAAIAMMTWLLAHGMRIPLDFGAALTYVAFIQIAQAIPFFYAGFGIREVVVVAFLGSAGLATEPEAMALSVGIGMVNLLVGLPGVLLFATLRLVRQPSDPAER